MNFNDRMRDLWRGMTAGQRVRIGVALVATLALLWVFTLYANRIRYGVLFTNLSQDDAGRVVAELKDRNVEYRLAANGSIVEVPFERIDDLRMELAADGLTPGGGVGFEIFDKPSFGLSSFVQNVNFQRALERELARTIQSLDAVNQARVHLALPPESVFAEDRAEPSASVVVRLRPGRTMPKDAVRAIANLVASGVEGMRPAAVSVIDGEGRMLSGGDDEASALTATQYEAKREHEQQIEQRLLALLEPIVGRGKVRARANVDLNFQRVDRVQEAYDPNVALVRSEQKSKTTSGGAGAAGAAGAAPGGVPGAASNLPGGAAGGPPTGPGATQSQSTVTNFELNKTVSTISEPVGNVQRQTVAVVVDHAAVESTATGGAAERATRPRSAEEMRKIEELVRAAIGFDERRRDSLIVQNVPFENPLPLEEDGGGAASLLTLLPTILRYGSLPLAVLLLALFVIRPAIAAIRGVGAAAAPVEGGPPTVAQLEARLAGEAGALGDGGSNLRARLLEAIREDPQTAALVVRRWMNE